MKQKQKMCLLVVSMTRILLIFVRETGSDITGHTVNISIQTNFPPLVAGGPSRVSDGCSLGAPSSAPPAPSPAHPRSGPALKDAFKLRLVCFRAGYALSLTR